MTLTRKGAIARKMLTGRGKKSIPRKKKFIARTNVQMHLLAKVMCVGGTAAKSIELLYGFHKRMRAVSKVCFASTSLCSWDCGRKSSLWSLLLSLYLSRACAQKNPPVKMTCNNGNPIQLHFVFVVQYRGRKRRIPFSQFLFVDCSTVMSACLTNDGLHVCNRISLQSQLNHTKQREKEEKSFSFLSSRAITLLLSHFPYFSSFFFCLERPMLSSFRQ